MAIWDVVRRSVHVETTTEMGQHFNKQTAPLNKNPSLLGAESAKTVLKGLVDFCASKIGGSLNERLHEALTKPGTYGVRAIFDDYREAFKTIATHERAECVAEQNMGIAQKSHTAAVERYSAAKNNYDVQSQHYSERYEAAKAKHDDAQARHAAAQLKFETVKEKLDMELDQLEQAEAIFNGVGAR